MNQLAKIDNPYTLLAEIEGRMNARLDVAELDFVAAAIIGRYTQRDVADADMYYRQLIALLAEYPAEVVELFKHPKTCPIPSSQFLPSIPTVAEAADKAMKRLTWWHDRARRDVETVASIEREIPSEERAEVAAGLRDLSDSLKAKQEQQAKPKGKIDRSRSQGSGEQLRRARIEAGMIPPEKELVE